MRKPIGILHFRQLFRLMEEDEKTTPAPAAEPERFFDVEDDILPISYASNPQDIIRWLKWRGYRVVAGGTGIPGGAGVVFGRKNGPATVAVVGDVLEWDGRNVVLMD